MKKLNLEMSHERSISMMVCETLRKAIIKGILEPGERLVEAKIAEELEVSLTPVRQAFSYLAAEGLIIAYPFKGTYVIDINKTFIEEVFSMRESLELLALEYAMPNITLEDIKKLEMCVSEMEQYSQAGVTEKFAEKDVFFHKFLYERSNHSILIEMLNLLQSRILLLQSYGRNYSPDGKALEDHKKIINAIQAGDKKLTKKLIKEHIQSAKTFLEQNISE